MTIADHLLPGATKDRQSITADWQPTGRDLIDGVRVHEVRNVIKGNGTLTEIFRTDWGMGVEPVDQVFQVSLVPGGISAWHTHEVTTDRLFVNAGAARIVLYDARAGSATYGVVNEFRIGAPRPTMVLVPPGVWHGVQCISPEPCLLLNLVDRAYRYEDPDHWRLPEDSPEIPFRFTSA